MKPMIAMNVDSLLHIDQAWLFKNHKHTYVSHGKPVLLLPSIAIEHKDILDKEQIPYQILPDGKTCEFWDPNVFEEVELTLPMYVQTGENYRYIRDYTEFVVTNETTDAAIALWESKVYPEVNRREEEKRRKQLHADLKRALGDKIACGADTTLKIPDLTSCARRETYVNSDKLHCKVFPVLTLMSDKAKRNFSRVYNEFLFADGETNFDNAKYATDFIAIFNLDKVHKDAVVEMQVPKGAEPIFVGKNGWQVREWCRKLGLKKIVVRGV